jgi:hypothetical protein
MGEKERLAVDFDWQDPEERVILERFHEERRTIIHGVELPKTDMLHVILRQRYMGDDGLQSAT